MLRQISLRYEDQVFVGEFVRGHGSIKHMEKAFGVSYPTIKNRLNRLGEQFDFVKVSSQPAPQDVLTQLEKGEITVNGQTYNGAMPAHSHLEDAEIVNAMRGGDRVELRGFGAFSVKERNARMGRNPATGVTLMGEPTAELDIAALCRRAGRNCFAT